MGMVYGLVVWFLILLSLYTPHADSDTSVPNIDTDVVIPIVGSDYPPYLYKSSDGELYGKDIVLLRDVLRKLGKDLYFVDEIPSKRFVSHNENLGFNAVLAITPNDIRAEKLYFSEPYRKERVFIFFSRPILKRLTSTEEFFKHAGLGGVRMSGYYGDDFKELKLKYSDKLIHVENYHIAMELLLLGRIDFYIGDINNISELRKDSRYSDIMNTSFTVVEQDITFAFLKSKFSESFVERFNIELRLHKLE